MKTKIYKDFFSGNIKIKRILDAGLIVYHPDELVYLNKNLKLKNTHDGVFFNSYKEAFETYVHFLQINSITHPNIIYFGTRTNLVDDVDYMQYPFFGSYNNDQLIIENVGIYEYIIKNTVQLINEYSKSGIIYDPLSKNSILFNKIILLEKMTFYKYSRETYKLLTGNDI